MKRIIAIITLLCVSVSYSGEEHLKLIETGKHISGTNWKAQQLKGKVILVDYWGIECSRCKAVTPAVVKLYNEFLESGKFEVICSSRQKTKKNKVKGYFKGKKATFSVYDQLKIPNDGHNGALPYFMLFDHKGKMVAKGQDFMAMQSKVKSLVNLAPEPMIADVKTKHFGKQAATLKKGKSVKAVLDAIKKKVAGDPEKLKEFNAITAAVTKWGKAEIQKVELLLNQDLAHGITQSQVIETTFKGLDLSKTFLSKMKALKNDKNFADFMTINRSADKAKSKFKKKKSSTHKAIKSVQARLDKFLKIDGLDEALINAAQKLKKKLPKLPKKS